MSTTEIEAFVIGPIGDKDAEPDSLSRLAYEEAIEIFEEVIAPACNFCGVNPVRADQISRTGEITDQIFRKIKNAYLVIADLSGANPNVMYELGLRHSTGKLTIQIGNRDRLPFDISAIRTIRFRRTPGGLVEARRLLAQAITTALNAGGDPVTATRIWFEENEQDAVQSNSDHNMSEDAEELGFLELIANSEKGMAELLQVVTSLTSTMIEISSVFESGTKRTKLIESRAGYSADRLAIANQVADELAGPVTKFGIITTDFQKILQRIQPGIHWLLDQVEANPEEIRSAPESIDQMLGFVDAVRGSMDGAKSFRTTAQNLGAMTKKMKKVSSQILRAVDGFVVESEKVLDWEAQLKRIRDQQSGESA